MVRSLEYHLDTNIDMNISGELQHFRGCAEVSDTNGCINENGEVRVTLFIDFQ